MPEHRKHALAEGDACLHVVLASGDTKVFDGKVGQPGTTFDGHDLFAVFLGSLLGRALLNFRPVHLTVQADASGPAVEAIKSMALSVIAKEAPGRTYNVLSSRFLFDLQVEARSTLVSSGSVDDASTKLLTDFLDELLDQNPT